MVQYTSPQNAGVPLEFRGVANADACALAIDSYYLVPAAGGFRVVLCPQTCTRVRTDAAARIDVLADCERI